MLDERLKKSWWALRLSYGIVPIVAGVDKFTNLLTDWTQYLSPLVERVLPFSGATFMHLTGVIEIVAGILVLTSSRASRPTSFRSGSLALRSTYFPPVTTSMSP